MVSGLVRQFLTAVPERFCFRFVDLAGVVIKNTLVLVVEDGCTKNTRVFSGLSTNFCSVKVKDLLFLFELEHIGTSIYIKFSPNIRITMNAIHPATRP